ncbi:MAG TPA: hypothetical protein DDW67_10320, partial [Elusimicrobia bacterium]|nr:hypothetical protein [Elusimicrobiota bacterium]
MLYRPFGQRFAAPALPDAFAAELRTMATHLGRVPWEPPATFWEAVQALWLNHMLVM